MGTRERQEDLSDRGSSGVHGSDEGIESNEEVGQQDSGEVDDLAGWLDHGRQENGRGASTLSRNQRNKQAKREQKKARWSHGSKAQKRSDLINASIRRTDAEERGVNDARREKDREEEEIKQAQIQSVKDEQQAEAARKEKEERFLRDSRVLSFKRDMEKLFTRRQARLSTRQLVLLHIFLFFISITLSLFFTYVSSGTEHVPANMHEYHTRNYEFDNFILCNNTKIFSGDYLDYNQAVRLCQSRSMNLSYSVVHKFDVSMFFLLSFVLYFMSIVLTFVLLADKHMRVKIVGFGPGPLVDLRADSISQGTLKHNDPIYADVEVSKLPFACFGSLRTLRFQVSLELYVQICNSKYFDLDLDDKTCLLGLKSYAYSLQSINLDRYNSSWNDVVHDTLTFSMMVRDHKKKVRALVDF